MLSKRDGRVMFRAESKLDLLAVVAVTVLHRLHLQNVV
jgi:hypothetical protein